MIAPLEQLIDWSSVQIMTLMMPAKEYDWRLEQALRFLKSPDFVPTDSQPASQIRIANYRYTFSSKANFNKLWLPRRFRLWQMFSG